MEELSRSPSPFPTLDATTPGDRRSPSGQAPDRRRSLNHWSDYRQLRRHLIARLPAQAHQALSARDIAEQLLGQRADSSQIRLIRRWLESLVEEGEAAQVVESAGDPAEGGHAQRPRRVRFYRLPSARPLIDEAVALQILAVSPLLDGPLQAVDELHLESHQQQARQALSRACGLYGALRDRLLVVHDGIGRRPARVNRAVLRAVLQAVQQHRQLRLDYGDGGERSTTTLSVKALVAKDGTLYLVGRDGTKPLHPYALHRVAAAEVTAQPEQYCFDDTELEVIRRHFEMGHPVPVASFPMLPDANDAPRRRSAERPTHEIELIDLRLRVAPRALFHFRERRMTDEQRIFDAAGHPLPDDQPAPGDNDNPDTWPVVEARLPYTVLLLPFLLSLGPWLVVEGPLEVREQMQGVTRLMAQRYATDAAQLAGDEESPGLLAQ